MQSRTRPAARRFLVLIAAISMAIATLVVAPASAQDRNRPTGGGALTLTILHNNDGESALIDAGGGGVPALADFGGVSRFASVVGRERSAAQAAGNQVVLVSSGDNILPGPQLAASLAKDELPIYDAFAMDRMRYDAITIGNHDFDLGPDFLVDFIDSFRSATRTPHITSNLDFSGEAALQAQWNRGSIAPAVTVNVRGDVIGIVGATTPEIPYISSPRNVVVDEDVAARVQEQIDRLIAHGVNKIIVSTHLQDVDNEIELASHLTGVDVIIAGGGAELLANPSDPLVPGDTVYGSYPLLATSADGKTVPVVTTNGNYKYLGRLDVTFNNAGEATAWTGGPKRVAAVSQPGGVRPDPVVQSEVVEPVVDYVAGLAANVIGQSAVALEGRQAPGVRTQETNLGNLMADSLLWQAQQNAAAFGLPQPQISVQNGGGIRNASLIPSGAITEKTTFDIAPFANFVSIVPGVSRETVKNILENGYAFAPGANGRFTQVAGLTVTYSLSGTPIVIATDGTITTPGTRVRSVVLDDGTVIVQDGNVVAGPPINVATIDFLARGGDQYPFGNLPFGTVGATYQQGLFNYIVQGLSGQITAADYPEGGEGRIVQIP